MSDEIPAGDPRLDARSLARALAEALEEAGWLRLHASWLRDIAEGSDRLEDIRRVLEQVAQRVVAELSPPPSRLDEVRQGSLTGALLRELEDDDGA
jgi:hypothetical protein